jgi:transposase
VLCKKFGGKEIVEFLANFHPSTVVMDACNGAHYYMARQLTMLGHRITFFAPQVVKPFAEALRVFPDRSDIFSRCIDI